MAGMTDGCSYSTCHARTRKRHVKGIRRGAIYEVYSSVTFSLILFIALIFVSASVGVVDCVGYLLHWKQQNTRTDIHPLGKTVFESLGKASVSFTYSYFT